MVLSHSLHLHAVCRCIFRRILLFNNRRGGINQKLLRAKSSQHASGCHHELRRSDPGVRSANQLLLHWKSFIYNTFFLLMQQWWFPTFPCPFTSHAAGGASIMTHEWHLPTWHLQLSWYQAGSSTVVVVVVFLFEVRGSAVSSQSMFTLLSTLYRRGFGIMQPNRRSACASWIFVLLFTSLPGDNGLGDAASGMVQGSGPCHFMEPAIAFGTCCRLQRRQEHYRES